MKILFVCTGNTCRSAMAEAMGHRWQGWICDSAGIHATPEVKASRLAMEVCEQHGLSLEEHRAKLLTQELLDAADLVLTMTKSQKDWIALSYKRPGLLFTLGEYAGAGEDVQDPWGGSIASYEETFAQLQSLISSAWKVLSKNEEDSQ